VYSTLSKNRAIWEDLLVLERCTLGYHVALESSAFLQGKVVVLPLDLDLGIDGITGVRASSIDFADQLGLDRSGVRRGRFRNARADARSHSSDDSTREKNEARSHGEQFSGCAPLNAIQTAKQL